MTARSSNIKLANQVRGIKAKDKKLEDRLKALKDSLDKVIEDVDLINAKIAPKKHHHIKEGAFIASCSAFGVILALFLMQPTMLRASSELDIGHVFMGAK